MLYLTKAELVAEQKNRTIHTISHSFPYPSVIRLSSYIHLPFKKIELSRKNILRRDGSRCQYCGTTSLPMTVDHIIPKSRGGADTWENLCCACIRCNNKKGSKTPEEAHITLLKQPRKPSHVTFIKYHSGTLDEKWKPYLFM